MALLIDGYNLLHVTGLDQQCAQFIMQIRTRRFRSNGALHLLESLGLLAGKIESVS